MRPTRACFVLSIMVGAAPAAFPQTSPARGPIPQGDVTSQEQRLADYLGLLRQIAPPAEAAARTYVAAMRLRCGRATDATELRQAMSKEGGDPVLMGLIHAEAMQDLAARRQLVERLHCKPMAAP